MNKRILPILICALAVCALLGSCGGHKHTEAVDAAVSATCTSAGLTEGKHCSDCGEVLVAQTEVPALGHDYSDTVTTATCTEGGYTTHTCTRCQDSYTDTVTDGLGHNHVTETVAPTCAADGYTVHTCDRDGCSDTYKDSYVAATAHRFNGGDCLGCGMAAPTEELVPNTEWYVNTQMAFTITTKEELAGLASLVNSGTSFAGKTIYLGNDIDLGYLEWTPIGTATNPFTATFDGKGYTISSLKISKNISYVGLFGYVKSEIGNFTVDNATVWVDGIQNYAAIACGYSTADIRNVTVDGYVDAKLSSYVGGIAGYTTAQLISLTSYADVEASAYAGGISGYTKIGSALFKDLKNYGSISVIGIGNVGGIVGKIESNGTLYIENCESHGDIVGKDYTGGLVGTFTSTGSFSMDGCSNYGEVGGGEYTGGVFGYFRRSTIEDTVRIKNFKNDGNVSGNGNVGGIFGYYWCVGTTNIIGCENNGNITGSGQYVGGIGGFCDYVGAVLTDFTNRGDVIGTNYSAGIIGYIEICEWDLDIMGFINEGDVNGITYTAGIVGSLSANGTPSITKCQNSGNISGNNNIGGIVGYGSFQTLLLSELESDGDIIGTASCVGGIAGYIKSSNYALTAEKCQSAGKISGTSHVAGLFGYISGNTSSIISNSSAACDISAHHTTGAIAGEAVNVTISECSNTGSSISASSFYVSGSYYYAYLGGIVGIGYSVEKCTNDVTINYTNQGTYVGGIAGYLKHSVTECTNNADISGYSYVGGIAGWVSSPSAVTLGKLTNSGDISGHDYVGGIVGKWEYKNSYTLTDCENSGKISGNLHIAGIIGQIYRAANYDFYITNLKNTGDVTANGGYVGGLIGYAYGYSANSVFENCSSSANITGLHTVGGLLGHLSTGTLKNSTNAGSTVTATGFDSENSSNLGGYIGIGGYADGLTNDIDIVHNQIGNYVGGIIGRVTSTYTVSNCTNNGNITSSSSYVGGIIGGYHFWLGSYSANRSFSNLKNTGTISGVSSVGGIIGHVYSGSNSGYSVSLAFSDLTNLGEIIGSSAVGEIFGDFYSDGASTLTGCTVLGSVTEGGAVIENRDVGANTNLTISERVIYTPESEGDDTTEDTEGSENTENTENPEA